VNGSQGDLINAICSKDELGWKAKHLKTLAANYKRSKFFDEIYSDFSSLLNISYRNIASLNATIIKFLCEKLGIKTSFVVASTLNLSTKSEQKIIDICCALKCNIYYSGTGAMAYQKDENFAAKGIILKYSEFRPFEYPQLWGAFRANVTIIDYLMNCGYNWTRVLESQNFKMEK
jgi:hypothetical protein